MNKTFMPYLLDHYTRHVVLNICSKYGLSEFDALRGFLFSETYRMLCSPELAMWEFSPLAILDIWECEKITGDPRNSFYIMCE